MANKTIFMSRLSHEQASQKIKKIVSKIFQNRPSRTDENPVQTASDIKFNKEVLLQLSFKVNLHHPLLYRGGSFNKEFLRKETIVYVKIEVTSKASINEDENVEVIVDESSWSKLEQEFRMVFNRMIRNAYYGFATEAIILTAIKKCIMNGDTFEGITFKEVFLSSRLQDKVEKIDGQLIYMTDRVRSVFHFSIKSSPHRMAISIRDHPLVYHIGITHTQIHYLAIGQALAKMILAKERGEMLHFFIDYNSKLMQKKAER